MFANRIAMLLATIAVFNRHGPKLSAWSTDDARCTSVLLELTGRCYPGAPRVAKAGLPVDALASSVAFQPSGKRRTIVL